MFVCNSHSTFVTHRTPSVLSLFSEITGNTYPGTLVTWLIPFSVWTKSGVVEFPCPSSGKKKLGDAVHQHGQKCSCEQNAAWTAIVTAKHMENRLPKFSLSKGTRITKPHTAGGIHNIYLEASSSDAYTGRWVPSAWHNSSKEYPQRAQLFVQSSLFLLTVYTRYLG